MYEVLPRAWLQLLSSFNDLTKRPDCGSDGRSCCPIILHLFAFYTLIVDDQGAAAVAEDFRRVLARLAGRDGRLLVLRDLRKRRHWPKR